MPSIYYLSPDNNTADNTNSFFKNSALLASAHKFRSREHVKSLIRNYQSELNNYTSQDLSYQSRFIKRGEFFDLDSTHLPIISKFTNVIMRNGKKTTAENIMTNTFKNIKLLKDKSPLLVFKAAYSNSKPYIENVSMRKKGRVRQFPILIDFFKQNFLAMSYIINAVKNNKKVVFDMDLYKQLILSASNSGKSRQIISAANRSAKDNLINLSVRTSKQSSTASINTIFKNKPLSTLKKKKYRKSKKFITRNKKYSIIL